MKRETKKVNANQCDERLVRVSGDQITTICGKGDEHSYTVAKEVKVTCDGRDSKLSDLVPGCTIRMTLLKDDKQKVLTVDSGKHVPSLSKA